MQWSVRLPSDTPCLFSLLYVIFIVPYYCAEHMLFMGSKGFPDRDEVSTSPATTFVTGPCLHDMPVDVTVAVTVLYCAVLYCTGLDYTILHLSLTPVRVAVRLVPEQARGHVQCVHGDRVHVLPLRRSTPSTSRAHWRGTKKETLKQKKKKKKKRKKQRGVLQCNVYSLGRERERDERGSGMERETLTLVVPCLTHPLLPLRSLLPFVQILAVLLRPPCERGLHGAGGAGSGVRYSTVIYSTIQYCTGMFFPLKYYEVLSKTQSLLYCSTLLHPCSTVFLTINLSPENRGEVQRSS